MKKPQNNAFRITSMVLMLLIMIASVAPQTVLAQDQLQIGWASADITPDRPVLIQGQFHARLSEGVLDPIFATAMALESIKNGKSTRTIMVAADLASIADGLRRGTNLRDKVRSLAIAKLPELKPTDITINATHTHTAPVTSEQKAEEIYGVSLQMIAGGKDAMEPMEYFDFAAQKIADAVVTAWQSRKPGGISYGLTKAVLGRNRLQVDLDGKSLMYGNTSRPEFSHIEGYEDHNLNLLYTWDKAGKLTGVVINAAVPSQVSEQLFQISADFWTETRALIRKELGNQVYVLPQVSAAGDQSPRPIWDGKAELRMQKIMEVSNEGTGGNSITLRRQIARYITDGVKSILPYMKDNIEWNPVVEQKTELVPLSRRLLGKADLESADKETAEWQPKYEKMLADAKANPEITKKPRWYTDITIAHTRFKRGASVHERYKLEQTSPKLAVEIKVIRIGEMAFATNPFELYLDYGIQMKVKSPATQTFVVQLAGGGSYLPTQRSINGGAYGAVPASTIFGPEGGKELVAKTVEMLNSLW